MATNPRKPFFERLKTGLNEGIAHARGELTLKTAEVPAPTGDRRQDARSGPDK